MSEAIHVLAGMVERLAWVVTVLLAWLFILTFFVVDLYRRKK